MVLWLPTKVIHMTTMHSIPFSLRDARRVRVGFIGTGKRGQSLINDLLACPGAELIAVADAREDALGELRASLNAKMQQQPAYFCGPDAWRALLEMDLDLVCIATSWDTHVPMATAAMLAGKHVAVEVPAAQTVAGCWQLVETSEHTRRHCVMLENCCYGYWEMLVKRMVHAGLLGTITHAECAYIHDLRHLLLQDEHGHGRATWRRQGLIQRNGNLYPTHGLGPVAQCLRIGDDDRFDYMVSMSGREASLSEYRDRHVPAGDPRRDEVYRNGDLNVSLIRTRLGRTIVLQHSLVSPRPYDRIFLLSGTRGAFRDYPPRLYLDAENDAGENWVDAATLPGRAQWEDTEWVAHGEEALKQGGHGGMDFIMMRRLIETMRAGAQPDMDVYDAADWSVPGPLSELSAANRSQPVDFPDFRRAQD